MKTRTEGVTELIVEAAEKEFLEYGYTEASLRRIAAACNVSTHTIYTRFDGKEGLLDAVVGEVAEELKRIHRVALGRANAEATFIECKDKAVEGTEDFLAYIYTYFEKFKIIICKSAGTKYEHYLDELAEVEESFYKQKIGTIRGRNEKISDFFIHAICSVGFKPIYEVVSHDLPLEEAREYMEITEQFNFGGWAAVFEEN